MPFERVLTTVSRLWALGILISYPALSLSLPSVTMKKKEKVPKEVLEMTKTTKKTMMMKSEFSNHRFRFPSTTSCFSPCSITDPFFFSFVDIIFYSSLSFRSVFCSDAKTGSKRKADDEEGEDEEKKESKSAKKDDE